MTLRPIGQCALPALVLLAGTAWSSSDRGDHHDQDQHHAKRFYAAHALVSDGARAADHVDASLRNPWGIAFNPTGFVWIANNKTDTSTLYDGAGAKVPLGPFPEVLLPPGAGADAAPTGIVFSASEDFVVSQDGVAAPSRFIFAGEHGTIMGWAPTVNLGNAVLAYEDHTGALYKGLALAQNGQGNFLYATDFHHAKVDVFDRTFARVTLPGGFKDDHIPPGYAPFGIQNIQGNLYVTFAKQDAKREDDVRGAGFGFVDVFDANGYLLRRIAARGPLNAPWGLALAPADFGRFSNRLLVGNFGDGTIDAFDAASGAFLGRLRGADDEALRIEGLWGLSFGNGLAGQSTGSLFFTSAPDDEQHGVYGRIDPAVGDGHSGRDAQSED